MYVERGIDPIGSTSLQSDLEKRRKFAEAFQDILQRTLNGKSNSLPPKIEITGILIPCHQEVQGHLYKYKLGTEFNEYLLFMSDKLSRIAKNAEWEEVSIKGYLEIDNDIFEVEKITLMEIDEPAQVPASFREMPDDLEAYERTIFKKGKIEPPIEYLAS